MASRDALWHSRAAPHEITLARANLREVAVIDRIDHIVLNCRDLETTVGWYERVLGFKREDFGPQRRTALTFGRQKFNVRPTGSANWRTARADVPGSLD